MARGLNRATIIGFVEREPEKRYTAAGQAVVSCAVLACRHWTTQGGDDRESKEWFHVVAWGALAEAASERLKQGQRVYLEGPLQTRSWQDEAGQRHCRTEVVATTLVPLDGHDEVGASLLDEKDSDLPLCLNRVLVIGNLGRAPEMRYTPSGQAVASFSLATTRSWNDPSGERHDATEWFNVVAWGSLAEICHQYLTKGRRVFVEGELRTRGWEQPNGARHYRTELVLSEMIMLGPRSPGNEADSASTIETEELPF